MPEMDGFETAEEIRKSDTDVSIVFCTSYYTITNAGKGFEVAAEDFLSKPLLYRKVENILNKIYKKKLLNAEEKLFFEMSRWIDYAATFRYNLYTNRKQAVDLTYNSWRCAK